MLGKNELSFPSVFVAYFLSCYLTATENDINFFKKRPFRIRFRCIGLNFI